VATRAGGPLEDVLREADVPYRVIPRMRRASPAMIRRVLAETREVGVIHAHTFGSNVWGALAARLNRCRLIAQEHSWSGDTAPGRALWHRRWIAGAAQRFVAVSPNVAAGLLADGVPAHLVEIVPNGVHPSAALPRERARAALGLPLDRDVIGIVAGLRPEKAHDVMLRALERLLEHRPQLLLCVVGDGSERDRLRRLSVDLGVDASVVWAGERSHGAELVSAFDVGVVCSDREALPLAALELLAAGVPLVATAVGDLPAVLAGGVGSIVPPREPEALAAGILRVLDDPALSTAMSEAGRRRVREQYDFGRMVARFEALYREVVASGSPPARSS
jgi:glycosyltransferase involved in cell wall biosynthesis